MWIWGLPHNHQPCPAVRITIMGGQESPLCSFLLCSLRLRCTAINCITALACNQTSHPGCQSLNLAPFHESILASTWQVIANLPMQKHGRRAVIVVKKGLFALRSRRANRLVKRRKIQILAPWMRSLRTRESQT